MSAVVATPPSELLRRGEPRAPAAAVHEVHVTIAGELVESAQACTEPATGRAAISVVIGQRAGQPHVLATMWLGDGYEAMQHAHERARNLLRGDLVEVQGTDLRMRYHHSALALLVGAVTRIELLQAFGAPLRVAGRP